MKTSVCMWDQLRVYFVATAAFEKHFRSTINIFEHEDLITFSSFIKIDFFRFYHLKLSYKILSISENVPKHFCVWKCLNIPILENEKYFSQLNYIFTIKTTPLYACVYVDT